MGEIADQLDWIYRDFSLVGVPSSGLHEVDKAEARTIGPMIEAAVALAGMGALVSVAKATKALLDADLAHADGVVALVYADATAANNDIYVKSGASGSGSWTNSGALHNVIAGLAQPYVDAAQAQADRMAAYTGTSVPVGYLFALLDGSKAKRMAAGISDGTAQFLGQTIAAGGLAIARLVVNSFYARTATIVTLNGVDVATLLASVSSMGALATSGAAGAAGLGILDGGIARRAAVVTRADGRQAVANLAAQRFDDLPAGELYRRALGRPTVKGGGCFRTQFDFVASTGQSNAQGADGLRGIGMAALDALAMTANSASPGTPFVLSPANVGSAAASNTETPLFGFAAALRRRLQAENLLAAGDHTYRPIVSNDAVGGTNIAQRSKGGGVSTYANTIAALTKAFNDAQAGSLPGTSGPAMVKCLSLLNLDGETDALQGTTGASYKATSIQRMTDFSADIKAINNQVETPVELLMQCTTNQNRLTGASTITSAGSGGTNGTFALIIPAPSQAGGGSGVTAAGTFTVTGGQVTVIAISNKGAGYRGDLALTAAAFANCAGLTGASATLLSETITMPIATAQRELGQTSAQHVLVGPYYQFFNYKDYQHSDASGARQTGALMAAAHKAIWIDQAGAQADKSRWKCLQPTGVQRSGKCVWLRFDDAVGPLVFASMPWFGIEPNYGFSLVDSGGAALAISSVALSGQREVLIVASATIPAGAKVRYGFNTMTTRTDYYSGGGGNLRDSQGQWLKDDLGAPLHNWAIAFSENL